MYINVHFKLKSPIVVRYLHHPSTLLEALQKIGGILALFKIGTLLSYLHFRSFENKLDKYFKDRMAIELPDDDKKSVYIVDRESASIAMGGGG